MKTININIKVHEYTSRVLGVIKEKFGLKDKGEALDKFAEFYGDAFVEKEIKESLIKKMIKDCETYEKKTKFNQKMTIKDLDKLCGLKE